MMLTIVSVTLQRDEMVRWLTKSSTCLINTIHVVGGGGGDDDGGLLHVIHVVGGTLREALVMLVVMMVYGVVSF